MIDSRSGPVDSWLTLGWLLNERVCAQARVCVCARVIIGPDGGIFVFCPNTIPTQIFVVKCWGLPEDNPQFTLISPKLNRLLFWFFLSYLSFRLRIRITFHFRHILVSFMVTDFSFVGIIRKSSRNFVYSLMFYCPCTCISRRRNRITPPKARIEVPGSGVSAYFFRVFHFEAP